MELWINVDVVLIFCFALKVSWLFCFLLFDTHQLTVSISGCDFYNMSVRWSVWVFIARNKLLIKKLLSLWFKEYCKQPQPAKVWSICKNFAWHVSCEAIIQFALLKLAILKRPYAKILVQYLTFLSLTFFHLFQAWKISNWQIVFM